ncbi:MAG: autotransporter-associated beta strand repeat-containing protein [Pirellulales bacterium]|nr:autotransporter-associated beta strand repeat-containing protein [Pirellulales bacterium]
MAFMAVAVSTVAILGSARAQAQRALGLDVSAWQGNISQTTWNNIHNVENRDFVFIRSSRGGTTGYYNQNNADNDPPTNTLSQRYDDPYYAQNITRATSAGMYAGSYHFSRPDIIESTLNAGGIANTGADEADHFIQMAGPWMRPGYLLPVHDLEAGQAQRTRDELAQFAIDFSDRIYEVMGIRPAVYTGGNYANYVQGASSSLRDELVAGYPTLWSARWPNQSNPNAIPVQTEHPKDSYTPIYGPWDDSGVEHPWSFWQYASTGRLQSFNNGGSNLDFDVAQGGEEFLKDKLVPAVWMNNSSGDWSTLANWNSGQSPVAPVQGPGQVARVGTLVLPTPRLPGAAGTGVTSGQNDTVILDRASANITVTLSTGTHNIRKLYLREALNITGGSLTINYAPTADSTPISAQFSAAAALSGGDLSVHTLQIDAPQTFTLAGGSLAFNTIQLMPASRTPANIAVNGDVAFEPLGGAAAAIVRGSGSGSTGVVNLGGGNRTLTVADGASAVDLSIDVPVANGGLAKAGLGTLALTAANTYAGDTSVLEGTLRLAGPTLANAADVYITDGTLDLAFSGVDAVDSLFINGQSKKAGTWGAVGSGAEFTSPAITGAGWLEVATYIAPLPGDFNGDNVVDGADLAKWQEHAGMLSGATHEQGDANEDGRVDGADLLLWQQNVSLAPVAASSTATPEPTSLALFGLMAAAWAAIRRPYGRSVSHWSIG